MKHKRKPQYTQTKTTTHKKNGGYTHSMSTHPSHALTHKSWTHPNHGQTSTEIIDTQNENDVLYFVLIEQAQ